mgnify:FL=1|tara:strand:+ start:249 stop:530 length:282 start_codon:yes stop_codon:yes gene_type:complete
MSKDNTYNGWHNYATWRVNMEIFDGMEIEEPWTWDMCENYAQEILVEQCNNGNSLVFSYALAFINEVAWAEIADHLNQNANYGNNWKTSRQNK